MKPERDDAGRIAALPPSARFDRFVDRSDPVACWPWRGALVGGYGSFWDGKLQVYAHRYAYVHFLGRPIPSGLHVDHICHDPATCTGRCFHRRCVNPAHLRLVTQKENNARGRRKSKALRTHCPRGHEFTEANTYVMPDGARRCRRCQADQAKPRRALAG